MFSKLTDQCIAEIYADSNCTVEDILRAIKVAEGESVKLSIVDVWRLQGKLAGKQEEATALAMRLLSKRFGTVPEKVQSEIWGLPLESAEELVEAIFDFHNLEDVAAWLRRRNY